MTSINTQWAYYLGQPRSSGILKSHPHDFIVTEELGYELTGSGEHVFLWVEKQGLNTAFVAEQLAKHTGLPLRQVTYAGRKDKYAITRQWFGLHCPKGIQSPLEKLNLDGLKLLKQHRHNKKLKVGQLKGNRFTITLRSVSHPEEVDVRLEKIKQQGVPNYFGDQRFGVVKQTDGSTHMGGTLSLGLRMVQGETIKNRNKRNMAVSALRSALFNCVVSERVSQGFFDDVKVGDACALSGSNSFFITTSESLNDAHHRYTIKDISPTAPLVGIEKKALSGPIINWEKATLNQYQTIISLLHEQGVTGMRRAIKIWPNGLQWDWSQNDLTVEFSLPAGCFATSVLRECLQFLPSDDSGND